jgi:hypothetical protein
MLVVVSAGLSQHESPVFETPSPGGYRLRQRTVGSAGAQPA